jgi:hypothetical protein
MRGEASEGLLYVENTDHHHHHQDPRLLGAGSGSGSGKCIFSKISWSGSVFYIIHKKYIF